MNNKNTNSRRLVCEHEPTETETLEGNVSWKTTYHLDQQTIESGLSLVSIKGNGDRRSLRSIRHYNLFSGAKEQGCQQATKTRRKA